MRRNELTAQQWRRLQPLLPPQRPKVGHTADDYRTIIDGILWVLRTGARWQDLPERYGLWQRVQAGTTLHDPRTWPGCR